MHGFFVLIVPVLVLLAAAMVLLGVKVLFVKGGKFPSGHVHDNAALRERGIHCASHGSPLRTTATNTANKTEKQHQ